MHYLSASRSWKCLLMTVRLTVAFSKSDNQLSWSLLGYICTIMKINMAMAIVAGIAMAIIKIGITVCIHKRHTIPRQRGRGMRVACECKRWMWIACVSKNMDRIVKVQHFLLLGQCGSTGWYQYGDSCFSLQVTSISGGFPNVFAAQEHCAKEGGDMASLNTEQKLEFVYNLVHSYPQVCTMVLLQIRKYNHLSPLPTPSTISA